MSQLANAIDRSYRFIKNISSFFVIDVSKRKIYNCDASGHAQFIYDEPRVVCGACECVKSYESCLDRSGEISYAYVTGARYLSMSGSVCGSTFNTVR